MKLLLRLLAAAGIFVAIQACAFAFALVALFPDIDRMRNEADTLEQRYLWGSHFAANRERYREQARELDRVVADARAALPDRIDSAFAALRSAAAARGLRIEVQPAPVERPREFYAELPARVSATGPFHRVGGFIGDLSRLPGVVLLDAFVIERASSPGLVTLSGSVRAFRYLSDAEVAGQRKAAVGKKGA